MFNAAAYFVDRHIEQGRQASTAIECAGRRLSYGDVFDQVNKVGGIWVSPAEVEHLLLEHPAVQACGVTGREDQDGLIKPVAHVVLQAGREAGAALVAEADS